MALDPPGRGTFLLWGFVNSIGIALGAFGLGVVIGIGGAYGKLYGGPILRDLLEVYTTLLRAVPGLVWILLLYFAGSDLVNQVLYDCVQFHGGAGFLRETAVERMARDARVQAIGGGASEVMLEEIAKRFGATLAD